MTRTQRVKASRFARVQFIAQRPELLSEHPEILAKIMRNAGLYSEQTKLSDIALSLPGVLRKARGVLAGRPYPPPDSKKPNPAKDWVELSDRFDRLKEDLNSLGDQLRRYRPPDPSPGV